MVKYSIAVIKVSGVNLSNVNEIHQKKSLFLQLFIIDSHRPFDLDNIYNGSHINIVVNDKEVEEELKLDPYSRGILCVYIIQGNVAQ